MKKVIGIGGIFFKSANPPALKAWYKEHLGIEADQYGAVFPHNGFDTFDKESYTVWSPFVKDTGYFHPSNQPFMINFVVDDLLGLLEELTKAGIAQVGTMEEAEYGKFAWIMDIEGNKIELWEPPKKKV
jgi:predicted enzyme related to lactoylglutathione lyase